MNSTELQEKINTYNSRKAALKGRAWFRTLEVIYWLALVLCSGIVLILTFSSGDDGGGFFFWGAIVIFVIFWVIKKVGYYVILGNIKTTEPDSENRLDTKLKK